MIFNIFTMINLVSYNCHSIRHNIQTVRTLLSTHEVVLLQELMIYEDDINVLDSLNDNFEYVAEVKDNTNEGIICGRPTKGMAIFWRKDLDLNMKGIKIDDRILALKMTNNRGQSSLLINVYFPYDARNSDSLDDYRNCVGTLESALGEYDISNIIVAGDFNADHVKNTRFWRELKHFIDKYNLFHCMSLMQIDNFTYLCPASSNTSFLDHVFCSKPISYLISNISVLYDLALYDHFPVHFEFDFDYQYIEEDQDINYEQGNFINWNKITKDDINIYKENIDCILNSSNVYSNEILYCNDFNCSHKSHIKEIDNIYYVLINILISASIFLTAKKVDYFKYVVGWNDYVKGYYKDAREHFKIWRRNGKPKNDILHHNMVNSRKIFKDKLKQCRRDENKIKDEKLASSYNKSNSRSFWSQIRNRKNGKLKFSSVINGEKNKLKIVNIFSAHYKRIFSNDESSSNYLDLNYELSNDQYFTKFSSVKIKNSIKRLNPSIGIDNVHSNHLLYASDMFIDILTRFINLCFQHCYFPDTITNGIIIPLLKNKFDDMTSIDNYRPIIKSSNFLKIIEILILDKISPYININDRQHGFRKNMSTLMAFFILKETILSYLYNGSAVFSTFLDLSKAFDRVNHNLLFNKLSFTGIPVFYLRIIKFIYNNQYVKVKYNGSLSESWRLENGVRQGGILSPLFFNLYINSLINKISSQRIGCQIGLYVSNIIAYADDLVLIAPSLKSLQVLINICSEELNQLKLKVNISKTFCMKFQKNTKKIT